VASFGPLFRFVARDQIVFCSVSKPTEDRELSLDTALRAAIGGEIGRISVVGEEVDTTQNVDGRGS